MRRWPTIRLLSRRIAKLLLDERMKNGRLLGTLLTHLVGEPQPIISEAHQGILLKEGGAS
jgi:hypothetical protein